MLRSAEIVGGRIFFEFFLEIPLRYNIFLRNQQSQELKVNILPQSFYIIRTKGLTK